MKERTILIIKPDGVEKGLEKEIISRIKEADLKIIATKKIKASEEQIARLYPQTQEQLVGMGNKSLKSYEEAGLDPIAQLGTGNPFLIGKMIRIWNIEYLTRGEIITLLLEGEDAISKTSTLVGDTIPLKAAAGTIRGDFSTDSALKANSEKRAIRNVVHATTSRQAYEFEEKIWFPS